MKYRDHKGGFSESMQTEQEINSMNELKDYIANKWGMPVSKIAFEHLCYDVRNGWETYKVMVKFKNYPHHVIVGYSNGNLN